MCECSHRVVSHSPAGGGGPSGILTPMLWHPSTGARRRLPGRLETPNPRCRAGNRPPPREVPLRRFLGAHSAMRRRVSRGVLPSGPRDGTGLESYSLPVRGLGGKVVRHSCWFYRFNRIRGDSEWLLPLEETTLPTTNRAIRRNLHRRGSKFPRAPWIELLSLGFSESLTHCWDTPVGFHSIASLQQALP